MDEFCRKGDVEKRGSLCDGESVAEEGYSTTSTSTATTKKEAGPSSVLLDNHDPHHAYHKLSMLQLRLDEATKTLQVERE